MFDNTKTMVKSFAGVVRHDLILARNNLEIKQRVHRWIGRRLASIVSWLLTYREVDKVFSDYVAGEFDGYRIDAGDIRNLDRYINDEVEAATMNFTIDAENVNNLDRELGEAVENAVEEMQEEVVKTIEAELEDLVDQKIDLDDPKIALIIRTMKQREIIA